jgi:hypothetical protein
MLVQPLEADYEIEVFDGGVRVTFRPTASEFTYQQLADPDDMVREGPLSRSPNVRHAGDTGRYDGRESKPWHLDSQVGRKVTRTPPSKTSIS